MCSVVVERSEHLCSESPMWKGWGSDMFLNSVLILVKTLKIIILHHIITMYYLSSRKGEQWRGKRGLGVDFIHKSNEKKEVSLRYYIFHTWWWRDYISFCMVECSEISFSVRVVFIFKKCLCMHWEEEKERVRKWHRWGWEGLCLGRIKC